MSATGVSAFSAIALAPSAGCSIPASASEPATPSIGLLVHNPTNDRQGAFDLKAIMSVRVAVIILMLGIVA